MRTNKLVRILSLHPMMVSVSFLFIWQQTGTPPAAALRIALLTALAKTVAALGHETLWRRAPLRRLGDHAETFSLYVT